MSVPFSDTELSLYELSTAKGTAGGEIKTYTLVQTMMGSLQPLSGTESEKYNKQTLTANYRFLVGQDQFTSGTLEAKLVEKNQLRSALRIFDIMFVENRTASFMPHYKVILQEIA